MSLSIQTNVASLIAQNNLRVNNDFQTQTITRLTSGFRINQSGDDAAGLAVANGYRSQIAELTQGVRNGNDGVSTLQIMDGGLNNITLMLDRMKTLATQAASSTSGHTDVANSEFQTLAGEITRQADNIGLGHGGGGTLSVYIGGGSLANSAVTVDLTGAAVDADSLGLFKTAAVYTLGVITTPAVAFDLGNGDATDAITAINGALDTLGTVQGTVGAGQNQLNYAINLANSQISSFSAAQSRIRDADVAAEASNLTKAQVLSQASIAAMAQANSTPQAVLALLK